MYKLYKVRFVHIDHSHVCDSFEQFDTALEYAQERYKAVKADDPETKSYFTIEDEMGTLEIVPSPLRSDEDEKERDKLYLVTVEDVGQQFDFLVVANSIDEATERMKTFIRFDRVVLVATTINPYVFRMSKADTVRF